MGRGRRWGGSFLQNLCDHCSNLLFYWENWFIFASPGDALITLGKGLLYFGWLWGDSSPCKSEMGTNRNQFLCRQKKRKWAWCENDSGAACSCTTVVVGKINAIHTEQRSLPCRSHSPSSSSAHSHFQKTPLGQLEKLGIERITFEESTLYYLLLL